MSALMEQHKDRYGQDELYQSDQKNIIHFLFIIFSECSE